MVQPMDMASLRMQCACVNRLKLWFAAVALLLTAGIGSLTAQTLQGNSVEAKWNFHIENGAITETVSGSLAQVKGNVYAAKGPAGDAVQMDGNTAKISSAPITVLNNPEELGVSAWIELDAYPWNLAPILDQKTPSGLFF